MEEKMKAERSAMNMLVDMLAEKSGDKKFIALKSYNDSTNKMQEVMDLAREKKLNDEQLDQTIQLFNQFNNLTKDLIEEFNK